eukprot:GHVU01186666.1.p1 GENE.GHVU01186666.1~~GHVU01186666.1.p1  ORF type:complete len:127 (-),score=9.14 GHVU01186666.1:803-1183(-)
MHLDAAFNAATSIDDSNLQDQTRPDLIPPRHACMHALACGVGWWFMLMMHLLCPPSACLPACLSSSSSGDDDTHHRVCFCGAAAWGPPPPAVSQSVRVGGARLSVCLSVCPHAGSVLLSGRECVSE